MRGWYGIGIHGFVAFADLSFCPLLYAAAGARDGFPTLEFVRSGKWNLCVRVHVAREDGIRLATWHLHGPPSEGKHDEMAGAVFSSKIFFSKFYYSLITLNLLSHAWSIKCM